MASVTSGLRRERLRLAPGLAVGLYGGTFDPPHAGHVHVASTALRRLALDRLIWLVAPRNPLKPDHPRDDLAQRLAAVRRLASGPRQVVTGLEADLGARFTVETVAALRRRFPGVRFVWIMGADGLASFHRWRDWRRLARLAPIAVVARPGPRAGGRFSPFVRRFAAARLPGRAAATLARRAPPAWVYLEAPLHAHASTVLRAAPDAPAPGGNGNRVRMIDAKTAAGTSS